MPIHGKFGGGGGSGAIATEAPGTFTATASASGVARFELPKGFLTEISVRVDGDVSAGAVTGGPVHVRVWLKRSTLLRELCSGAIQNELSVRGSGQLPVNDFSEIVVKWTELSGAAVVVRVDAFVDQGDVATASPAWRDETAQKYYWTYTNRFTESNAGGGNDTVTIVPAANSVLRVLGLTVTMADTAAGRTAIGYWQDEDAALIGLLGTVSLDNTSWTVPSIGGVPAANNVINSQNVHLIGDGSAIRFQVNGFAQNEYFNVQIVCEIMGSVERPTITHTSTGTASTGTPTQNEITVVSA